jgi:hypothetical protein
MQQFKQGFLPQSFEGEWIANMARLQAQDQELIGLRNINMDN